MVTRRSYDRYRPTDDSDDSDTPLFYDILEITSTSNPSQYIFNSNQSEGDDRRNRGSSLWVAHQVIAVSEVFTMLALLKRPQYMYAKPLNEFDSKIIRPRCEDSRQSGCWESAQVRDADDDSLIHWSDMMITNVTSATQARENYIGFRYVQGKLFPGGKQKHCVLFVVLVIWRRCYWWLFGGICDFQTVTLGMEKSPRLGEGLKTLCTVKGIITGRNGDAKDDGLTLDAVLCWWNIFSS